MHDGISGLWILFCHRRLIFYNCLSMFVLFFSIEGSTVSSQTSTTSTAQPTTSGKDWIFSSTFLQKHCYGFYAAPSLILYLLPIAVYFKFNNMQYLICRYIPDYSTNRVHN